MLRSGFDKFFWGFLFIMIDFRLQGIDVIPDIIGFIFFAVGFKALAEQSEYFTKAGKLNIIAIILAIFQIYDRTAQGGVQESMFSDPLGMIVGALTLIIVLAVVHRLFLGIKEMATLRDHKDTFEEAGRRWTQFLVLYLAAFCGFILTAMPGLIIIYIIALLVATVIITVYIMKFMKKCGESFVTAE